MTNQKSNTIELQRRCRSSAHIFCGVSVEVDAALMCAVLLVQHMLGARFRSEAVRLLCAASLASDEISDIRGLTVRVGWVSGLQWLLDSTFRDEPFSDSDTKARFDPSGKTRLRTKLDDVTYGRLQQFQGENGFKSRSEALRLLLEKGVKLAVEGGEKWKICVEGYERGFYLAMDDARSRLGLLRSECAHQLDAHLRSLDTHLGDSDDRLVRVDLSVPPPSIVRCLLDEDEAAAFAEAEDMILFAQQEGLSPEMAGRMETAAMSVLAKSHRVINERLALRDWWRCSEGA